jgi:hypothetical protein
MKNIIKKILKEETFSRDWMDAEYADEYPKYKKLFFSAIKLEISASGESETTIILADSNRKVLVDYKKPSKTLYYDYNWAEDIETLIPWDIYNRHFIYALAEYFNNLFPDVTIKSVRGANIVYN